MVDLSPAYADSAAQKSFLQFTPFAVYALTGVAAPGAPFSVRQRNLKRLGFGNSSTQVTLPGAGIYGLQLFDSMWSAGTSNPETIKLDVYDKGALAGSFSVDRPSGDPTDGIELASPFCYVEGDFSLTGPLEFRNGSGNNETAGLVLRLWQFPEPYSRPDPLALYDLAFGRVDAGEPYLPQGMPPQRNNVSFSSINASRVPYSLTAPFPGSYQVQVSGELRNHAGVATNLVVDIYEGESLLHSESVAAPGPTVTDRYPAVSVAIDETLNLSGGRFQLRNGRADDLQSAELLIKMWWLG